MDSKIQARCQEWLESDSFDEATKTELRSIQTDEKEIADRFYKELEFGTGGMRGLMGAGTNRLNRYTVRKATQGLANYIHEAGGADKGVVIVFDSRHNSDVFAKETALCLNANGIKTWIFDSLRPTPELSFAIRTLGAIAGVAITASHNPAEYNGYKVYWEDGGQITPPHDKSIMHYANAITSYEEVKTMNQSDAMKTGLYQTLGEDMDQAYLSAVRSVCMNPDVSRQYGDTIRIVYTPLHGAGNVSVRRLLSDMGFTNVFVVKSQEEPDGDFTTCPKPNPEEDSAWNEAMKLAKETDADLVMATDPDSDRLGLYAKDDKTGEYVLFTGDMAGILLCDYVLSRKQALGILPKNGVVMKTIVSSPMVYPIAKSYGVKVQEVLTGFKYIGEAIHRFEQMENGPVFLFGYEESLGILCDDYVRDKDAQCAVVLLAEAAAYYRSRNRSLVDAMNGLYERYGYYLEGLATKVHTGMEGTARIQEIMHELRTDGLRKIGGTDILLTADYQSGIKRDRFGYEEKIALPASNVIYYELEDGWCCIRPSGTEPKIKVYFGVNDSSMERASQRLEGLKRNLLELLG